MLTKFLPEDTPPTKRHTATSFACKYQTQIIGRLQCDSDQAQLYNFSLKAANTKSKSFRVNVGCRVYLIFTVFAGHSSTNYQSVAQLNVIYAASG